MGTHDRYNNSGKQIISVFIPVASTILIVCFLFYVYELFSVYDWEQPFAKLLCYLAICILITSIYSARKSCLPLESKAVTVIEVAEQRLSISLKLPSDSNVTYLLVEFVSMIK